MSHDIATILTWTLLQHNCGRAVSGGNLSRTHVKVEEHALEKRVRAGPEW